jgi:hypothetical protein
MADLSKDEFLAHIGPIRDDIKEIMMLQREQNGRVGRVETRVAVLEERTPPGKVSATVSAIVSGVISGLGVWFSSRQ